MSINERIARAKGWKFTQGEDGFYVVTRPDGTEVWRDDAEGAFRFWPESRLIFAIPDWEHDLSAAISLLKEFRAALQWCDYPSDQYWQVLVDIDHYLHPCGRISKDEPAMIIAEAYCLQMGLDIE